MPSTSPSSDERIAATVDSSNKKAETRIKKLYLLTDDGFIRQLLTQFVLLISVVAVVSSIPSAREAATELYYTILNDWMLATAHRYAWWSLLGLLSSSCCALQLLLNALSMGCAGFNTVLGPWRPTLLAWTCLVQATSWMVAWDRPYQWMPTATATVVVMSLALLPEFLHYCVHVDERNQTVAQKQSAIIQFHFQMTSVGCAACLVTIRHALNKLPGVVDIQACLETNILRVDCCQSANTTQDTILECLEEAGFPMEPIISS